MSNVKYYPDSIPIVFSSNNYFVPYTAVMMQSIMENVNSEIKISFFILHRDISDSTMKILNDQISINSCRFSLEFIDVSSFLEGYNLFTGGRQDLTAEAYFRLLIPNLFSEYKKVIYLDGDMICLADIDELYKIELGNNIIAASSDLLTISYWNQKGENNYLKTIMKYPDSNYFNSGMLVFNIQQFRNAFSTKELLNFAVSRAWITHDQDVLNVLCENKTLLLPMKWNFVYNRAIDNNVIPYVSRSIYQDYIEASENPKIIHFTSDRKPWKSPTYLPYFELFWKYASKTPFLNIIVNQMNKNHLIMAYSDRLAYDKKKNIFGFHFIMECFWYRILRLFTSPPHHQ
jgi:lipopolysaccharide biosynthesis glycosyltransferase